MPTTSVERLSRSCWRPRLTPCCARHSATCRPARQAASSRVHSSAAAPITCWQLSSTSSNCCQASTRATASVVRIPGCSRAPKAAATSAGSATGASSASHVPSAGRPATRRAISAASRVLPDLPGPVTVTSRRSSSSPATSRTGPARPRRSPHWGSHVNSPLACYGQQFTAGTANRLSQHTELNVLCAVLGLSSAISTRADSAFRSHVG